MKAHYLEISAEVSYWEDANVNGVDDIHGTLIPLREGNLWAPVIRLSDGVILNWPHGISAFDDYITLSIDTTGTIENWREPVIPIRDPGAPDPKIRWVSI